MRLCGKPIVVLGVVLAALVAASPALATEECEGCAPWWHLTAGARPAYLPATGSGEIYLEATNLGDAAADGRASPVVIKDKLPAGVTPLETEGAECALTAPGEPGAVTCVFAGELAPYGQIEVRIKVAVGPEAHTGELNHASVAGGGASRGVSIARPITLTEEPGEKTPFGLEEYEVTPENENGTPDTQAGSHPFQTTLTIDLNQGEAFTGLSGEPEAEPAGGVIRDLKSKLPPGLIGNPTPFPRCTLPEFEAETCPVESIVGAATVVANEPVDTGLKTIHTPVFNVEPAKGEPARFGLLPTKETPVFIDTSVRSGEDYGVTNTTSDIVEVASELRAQVTFWGVPGDSRHNSARGGCLEPPDFGRCDLTDEQHNPPPFFVLPTSCTGNPLESVAEVDPWSEPGHFAKASTSEPSVSEQPMPTLSGCNRLPFEPTLEVTPDATHASTPAGLNVDVHVPQEGELDGTSLAESAARTIALALPEGFALDPSAADGLEACSEGLVGFQAGRGVGGFAEFDPGSEPGVSQPAFTPYLPGSAAAVQAVQAGEAPASEGTLQPGVNFCPNASKLGEVTIKTPLLAAGEPLKGWVYLAGQDANPFASFLALYIVAEDPTSGMLVKLPGELSLNGATGQITVTFQNTPQVAFEDIEMHFFGGERALLASPARCGAYTTDAAFVPWSAEPWDEAAVTVHSSSTFSITAGPKTPGEPGGSSCPGASLPFDPAMTAGTTSTDAGSSTPLTVTISRDDGQQALRGFRLRLPPGLEGVLSSVPLCPEAQANASACGPASQIGETTVSAGVGGDPYTLAGGRVYLTGPYDGTGPCTPGQLSTGTQSSGCAPFGLAIVTPVKAGPLDLEDTPENHPACDCLVVRAKVEVDPQTAQLTITTGTGTGGIPTIIDGIPLQIRDLNITIGRDGFIFNPTDCASLTSEGTITGSEGATASVSSPFRVANCTSLKFAPKLTVSTQGKTSEANGASLAVELTYPKPPQDGSEIGEQANLGAVKIDLPKQLPSRLTTLQQACLVATFAANPAACPPESVIGHVAVSTPILPGAGGAGGGVPGTGTATSGGVTGTGGAAGGGLPGAGTGAAGGVLSGPAYFVSHGGEAFPDIELVLQGDGVKIDLVGTTYISKKRVTSVTFRAIPDVPVNTFTLTLPEGPFSALGTNKNLCKLAGKLTMPTALTGQNGAAIHESTKVTVTGCKKPAKRKKPRKHKKHA